MRFPTAQSPLASSANLSEDSDTLEAGEDAIEKSYAKYIWLSASDEELSDEEFFNKMRERNKRLYLDVDGNRASEEIYDGGSCSAFAPKNDSVYDGGSCSAFAPKNDSVYYSNADEVVAPPPEYSDVRAMTVSTKSQAPYENDNCASDDHLSAFATKNDSVYYSNGDEVVAPPPEHSDVRALVTSTKQAPGGENHNVASDETDDIWYFLPPLVRELTVKQLRLVKVLTVPETTTINEARSQMNAERAVVLVVTDSNALLCGILTDKDIETRVVAAEIDLANTPVLEVMTKKPIFVSPDTLALEALDSMMKGKVRQLPVIENGVVIALVSLIHCYSDILDESDELMMIQLDTPALLDRSRSTYHGSIAYTYTQIINLKFEPTSQ